MTRNTNGRKTAKGSNSTTTASTVVSGCILHIILNRMVNAIMYTYYIVVNDYSVFIHFITTLIDFVV